MMRIVSKGKYIHEYQDLYILPALILSPPLFIVVNDIMDHGFDFSKGVLLFVSTFVWFFFTFFTTVFSRCRIDFSKNIIKIKHRTFHRWEDMEFPINSKMFFYLETTKKSGTRATRIFLSVDEDEASQYPISFMKYNDAHILLKMNKLKDRLNEILTTANGGRP